MKSASSSSVLVHLAVVCSVWCLSCSAYEYNFQITHGSPASGGDGAGGPYEPQARSSVHFRGSQGQAPSAAAAATGVIAPSETTAPVYKDEQAHASEGYHGYSAAGKAGVPQYGVAQPDSKYRYAVEGQNDEPQTEIRYVSQDEAAKYHQYHQPGAEQEQSIKYVPAEEAHKYQQPAPAAAYHQQVVPQAEKYQGYRPTGKYHQEYEGPQSPQRYQAYQPAPQAEKYQAYQPAPAAEKYQSYQAAPAPEKYQSYQAAPQTYQAAPQPEKYQSYQADHQTEKYRGYHPSAIQKYPTADAEQKIQYVTPDQQQTQYSPAQQHEEQQHVQYVPQYAAAQSGGHAPAPQAYHSYGQANGGSSAGYDKQATAYAHPVAYQYAAPETKYHREAGSKFEYPTGDNLQYVAQPQYAKAPAPVAEKYTTSPYAGAAGQKVKFEFPAGAGYNQNGDYLKSQRAHHGVTQSASVAQPVAHKYVPHPELAQVAAHGASAYGHAYAGNAHPGYAHEGYAHHPGYDHQGGAPVGHTAVHALQAEPQVHAGHANHAAALQAYHVPRAAGHVTAQAHAPVHQVTSQQHSFPDHLAHGIARGSHKVHDFYDEKKAAAKKSSKKKKSS